MGCHRKAHSCAAFLCSHQGTIPTRTQHVGILNRIALFLLLGLRPLLGPAACPYEPTCGKYAADQLELKPLSLALWAIIKRLLSCRPF